MKSGLAALAAVILWSSLAALATLLTEIPPFLKTGIGLLLGSLIALPLVRFDIKKLKVSWKTLLLGVYGLFGYHAALFIALQNAPSVQANLVNYLWPLLIILLAPLFIKTSKLTARIVFASLIGFAGAAIAVLSGGANGGGFEVGYIFALIAAVVWATYSLGTKVVAEFPTAVVGVFAFVAGILALVSHWLFEERAEIVLSDWPLLLALGVGPLGAAFYFWDYALKHGNPQQVGLLSFLTPLLSTVLLVLASGSEVSPLLLVSALLIIGGALLGRQRQS
jgi:drug/metabolite transporter (DMT)-like permease